ncbi:MAG: hypothetical protein KF686_11395 [Ramlibacter sp.]|nr:hypothetical protein [Ramlibacter sp.]MBX3656824.1 hypothetical protein [Ramlibacter sp.]
MNLVSERAAPALLILAGLLTLLPLLPSATAAPPAPAGGMPLILHWQFMVALLGAGLLVAAFVPALRLAVLSGALLSKGALVLLAVVGPASAALRSLAWVDGVAFALVAVAGLLFVQAALQQARWEGGLRYRQE